MRASELGLILQLFHAYDSIHPSCLRYPFQEPEVHIDNAALDSWKRGQLANAEALLTAAIHQSQDTTHHILASRSLVRTRLQQWDVAIDDADEVFMAQFSHM